MASTARNAPRPKMLKAESPSGGQQTYKQLAQEYKASLAASEATATSPTATSPPPASASASNTPTVSPTPLATNRSEWKKPRLVSKHTFFTLPLEMQQNVLSHLPPASVSSLRSVCQEFHSVVDGCEDQLATPLLTHHYHRLQTVIDAINTAQLPTDADSLLESLRIWTARRHSCKDVDAAHRSLLMWFSHLAGGYANLKREPERFAIIDQWTKLAARATHLQWEMNRYRELFSEDQRMGGELWNFFEGLLHGHDMPISGTELQILYSRIESLPSAISGPFHNGETGTFPTDKCGRFLITPLRLTGRKHKTKQPLFPAAIMHGNLDLPALPESNIFCYYLR